MTPDGFLEPVVLKPAFSATDVVIYFPTNISGLAIQIGDWDVDMRLKVPRPRNQASVRSYISIARHRVMVKSSDCGELAEEFDFTTENAYKFLKVVRQGREPCTLAFMHDPL